MVSFNGTFIHGGPQFETTYRRLEYLGSPRTVTFALFSPSHFLRETVFAQDLPKFATEAYEWPLECNTCKCLTALREIVTLDSACTGCGTPFDTAENILNLRQILRSTVWRAGSRAYPSTYPGLELSTKERDSDVRLKLAAFLLQEPVDAFEALGRLTKNFNVFKVLAQYALFRKLASL